MTRSGHLTLIPINSQCILNSVICDFCIFYINNICSPYEFRFSLGNLTTEILKALEKRKIYLITGIRGVRGSGI